MRVLLVGATVAVALIAGALAISPVHAGGPETTSDEALAELVFAGAPLAAPATAATSSSVAPPAATSPAPSSSIGSPPPRPAASGPTPNAPLPVVGRALREAIRGFVDWALGFGDSSLNFVTRTPAEGTYGSPTVR